ncbi:MAG: hypothetical protein ACRDRL_12130 [Sciscionella sp.]
MAERPAAAVGAEFLAHQERDDVGQAVYNSPEPLCHERCTDHPRDQHSDRTVNRRLTSPATLGPREFALTELVPSA